ncbi:MAG: patatin family protein [Oscillospiraceae bacterium]|jgi:predicted patatin/cPLA2 family phospholipase|nr:patatin family protein [Oscillospiraceae bacterium]MCI2036214.1 patatin family protein [Oscillospiraceae bacterium]
MSTGCVLEGGGMRGWYTSGVLTALKENGIFFPTVYGISAGAFHALPYIAGQISREYIRFLLHYASDPRCISKENLSRTGSAFGFDFLFGELFHHLLPFDYRAFFRSPVELKVGVTDLKTGRACFYGKTFLEESFLLIRASCSLPLVSNVIHFQGRDLLDGGCSNPIPAEYALSDGNDRIVVVLTRDASYRKSPEPEFPFSVLREKYGNYPAFLRTMMRRSEIYNGELDACARLEQEKRALLVRPSTPIRFSRYENDPRKLTAVYEMGIRDGKAKIPEIKAFLGI